MAGTVGGGSLRTDIQQEVVDKTPHDHQTSLEEKSPRLRAADILQPFERSRTTEVATLPEFYELFQKVLAAASDYDGRSYEIRFTHEYPPVDAELPTFTIKLISRRPFEVNGRREYGPRYTEEFTDPDYTGDIISTELRRQQNVVQITVWGKTRKAVDELANWVEDKFFEYLWAFQWGGMAHPVRWVGRGEDIYKPERGNQIYGAPITFEVNTGKITFRRVTALRNLAVKLGILKEASEGEL